MQTHPLIRAGPTTVIVPVLTCL